jgi:hypothetical protein
MALKHIAEGWFNSFLDAINLLEPNIKILGEARMRICADCPVRDGLVCSSEKHGMTEEKEFFNGCGCPIDKKVLCVECKCPGGKW